MATSSSDAGSTATAFSSACWSRAPCAAARALWMRSFCETKTNAGGQRPALNDVRENVPFLEAVE